MTNVTMATNDLFTAVILRNSAGTNFGYLDILKTTSVNKVLRAYIYDDAGGTHQAGTGIILSDTPHYAEVYYQKATTASANDGSLQFWLDGNSIGSYTTADLYTRWTEFDTIQMGARFVDTGTTGNLYLDELVINNDGGLIGPIPENLWIFLIVVPFIPVWLKRRKKISELFMIQ
jgi:hypothetical protein